MHHRLKENGGDLSIHILKGCGKRGFVTEQQRQRVGNEQRREQARDLGRSIDRKRFGASIIRADICIPSHK